MEKLLIAAGHEVEIVHPNEICKGVEITSYFFDELSDGPKPSSGALAAIRERQKKSL